MLLTKTKSLLEAQRDASRKVAQGKKYSVDLPIIGDVVIQVVVLEALRGHAVGRKSDAQFDRKFLTCGVDGEMLNLPLVAATSDQTDKGGQSDRMFPLVGFR